ncbi:MAG: Holliday junction branch migration protein RuvA [Candidatus Parcubacteria bacterium]|jgi:Holliday junction DNA helicase RuvA
MIVSVSGKLASAGESAAILDVHGVGLKISTAQHTLRSLPRRGSYLTLYTHLHVREDALDLYGFPTEQELALFEQLISVSGVGPKSALAVLDVGSLPDITAAIVENRPDLLSRAPGIGKKTAERIVLELKSKIHAGKTEATIARMDADADLLETLVGLGYRREDAKAALARIDKKTTELGARLKAALKSLSSGTRP